MSRRPSPTSDAPRARRERMAPLAALGAIAASLILVACGGSTPASNAADSEQAAERKAETQVADFAKCMREHGVHAEAATLPGGGRGLKIGPPPGGPKQGSGGREQVEAAQQACHRYQPKEGKPVNLSPQEKAEREEAVQKFAKCMREHGIKVEASAAGGGTQIRIHGHPGAEGAPNPESPSFQSAQKDCQALLPGRPRGGGPGLGKTPGGESSGSGGPQSRAGG